LEKRGEKARGGVGRGRKVSRFLPRTGSEGIPWTSDRGGTNKRKVRTGHDSSGTGTKERRKFRLTVGVEVTQSYLSSKKLSTKG